MKQPVNPMGANIINTLTRTREILEPIINGAMSIGNAPK